MKIPKTFILAHHRYHIVDIWPSRYEAERSAKRYHYFSSMVKHIPKIGWAVGVR